jgi:hypothetical protein
MTVEVEIDTCKIGTCPMLILVKKGSANGLQKSMSEFSFQKNSLDIYLFLQTCYTRISKNTRLISLKFEKLNKSDFTKTCAIPSLPGSHTEDPQPTDTVVTSCETLPEFQAVSLSSADRVRAVHSVCTAAACH